MLAFNYGKIYYFIMEKITIKWGTDKDKTKSYTFKNEEEAKFFMMGVDEANGWLEYEVVSGWFDK